MTAPGLAVFWSVAAVLIVVVTLAGLYRVDETWRTHRWWCYRCLRRWTGTDKLCRCGARAYRSPSTPLRTPAVDWQGHMDTGPIPVISAPRPAPGVERRPAPRRSAWPLTKSGVSR